MLTLLLEPVVRTALSEDLGRAGDITTMSVIPPDHRLQAVIAARRPGQVAGVDAACLAFHLVDPSIQVERRLADGVPVTAGAVILKLSGPARGILTAERVALNFLGHLSGIATETRKVVTAIDGTGARVVCTRKTTPGLRALEKHAVRMGGGANHRFGLDDGILIKDNHLAVAGSVGEAVARARQAVGHFVKIEVEVDTLEQLDQALLAGVDAVLLDNMAPDLLRRAVARIEGRCVAEASGGIVPENARAIAETGVDLLSIGWLTHSAPTLDVGLDVLDDGSAAKGRHFFLETEGKTGVEKALPGRGLGP